MLLHTALNPTAEEVFELAPVGLLVCQALREPARNGQPGRIVDFQGTRVNEAAARLLGLSREQFLTQSFLETQPGARESGLFAQYMAVVETGTPATAQLQLDGHWYSGSTVRVGDGFLVSFINIDPAQAALQQEAEARALLQGVLDASPGAVVYLEPDRTDGVVTELIFRMANARSLDIGKRPVAELLGRGMLDLYPHTRTTGLFEAYVRTLETGEPFETEVEYVAPAEGISAWSYISAVRQGEGLVVTTLDITARKQAEMRLQATNESLQEILDGVPAQLFISEALRGTEGQVLDFRIVGANAGGLLARYLTRAEVLGKLASEVFPADRTNGIFERYQQVVESGERERFEWEFNWEGQRGWMEVRLIPLGTDRVIASAIDISLLKNAELMQQQQAELLQGVINAAQGYICYCEALRDSAGTIIDFVYRQANEAVGKMAGLSAEAILDRRMSEVFPGVKQNGLFRLYVEAVERGQSNTFEFWYEADGQTGWFLITARPLAQGFVLSFIDITDRKQTELDKQRQAEFLQSVIDHAQTGIVLFDIVRDATGQVADFRYRLSNAANSSVLSLPADALLNRTIRQVFPDIEQSDFFRRLRTVAETGEYQRYEQHTTLSGQERWGDVYLVRQGEGVLFTFLDITSLKQTQLQLERQAEEYRHVLDNALTAISHFTAIRDESGNVIDFRYESFNRMSEFITGRKAQDVIGRQMLELFPGVGESGIFNRWVDLMAQETPQRFQDHYQFDGFDFWFDTQAIRWGDGFIQSYVDITPIKQAQLAAQQQAEAFNRVINASLNGILLIKPIRNQHGAVVDFRINLFNDAAQRLTGIPGEYALTKTILDMDPNIGSSGLLQAAAEVLATDEPLRVEFFFEPRHCWFDVSVARLGDELVVTFGDVSAVRESILERQQHSATLEALLDGAINGIWALDVVRKPDGQIEDFLITAANRAAAEVLNRPLHELVGIRLLTAYPSNRLMGYFQHYVTAIETGTPQRFISHYHADGLDNWFDVSAIRQNPDRLVVTFIDVSEARRAQQALIGESVLFQTLSSHVPETGVLVINPSGRILFANGELPAIFKSDEQSTLPEQRLGDVLLPAYRTELLNALRQALNGRASQISTEINEAFYEIYYGPVENAEARVVMAMATFRNVTRDRLYQQQLKASNENLERFAYVASHDLQEPLRKIQAFGDMLFRKQAGQLDETSLGYIQRMQSASQRMTALIGDLLAYSRVSSKPPAFETVALPAVLRAVRSDLDLAIREKGAQLRIDTLPTLTGDATQLRQLFQNLISNALKFSRPGVPPVVELRYRPLQGTDLPPGTDLPTGGTYHELCFVDNGIGFEPQYAGRIFEAFQRLHGRSEYPGTGIGLAIVKKVVENHRGTILVESTPGQGSAFRVFLPVENAGI